jgi:hypothetical protein
MAHTKPTTTIRTHPSHPNWPQPTPNLNSPSIVFTKEFPPKISPSETFGILLDWIAVQAVKNRLCEDSYAGLGVLGRRLHRRMERLHRRLVMRLGR